MTQRIDAKRRLWNAERSTECVCSFVIGEHLAINL
jgi:hypothetical protein